jgi:hypothetical protein
VTEIDDSALAATANDALTLGRTVAVGVEATAKNGDITLTGAMRCAAETGRGGSNDCRPHRCPQRHERHPDP